MSPEDSISVSESLPMRAIALTDDSLESPSSVWSTTTILAEERNDVVERRRDGIRGADNGEDKTNNRPTTWKDRFCRLLICPCSRRKMMEDEDGFCTRKQSASMKVHLSSRNSWRKSHVERVTSDTSKDDLEWNLQDYYRPTP